MHIFLNVIAALCVLATGVLFLVAWESKKYRFDDNGGWERVGRGRVKKLWKDFPPIEDHEVESFHHTLEEQSN